MIRRRTASAALAVALLVPLGACASDSEGQVATMGAPASPPADAADDSAATEPDSPEPSDSPTESESGDPSTPPEPPSTVAPATGVAMTGTGYTYRAPEGWHDITKQMKESQQSVDTAIGEKLSTSAGVRDNMNVVSSPAIGDQLQQYEDSAPEALKFMVKDLDTYPRTTIAGEEAVHVGGIANTGGISFFFEQYAVQRGNTVYALSFAVEKDLTDDERRELIDSVITSWEWTN